MVKGLHLAVLLLAVWQSYAWIFGGDFSKEFERCTGIVSKNAFFDLDSYEQQCTDLLLPLDKSAKRIGNFTDEQMNYIYSIMRKMASEVMRSPNRIKRTVGEYGPGTGGIVHVVQPAAVQVVPSAGTWRVRLEVRENNGAPFQRYAKAVVKLKNVGHYDTLAQIHTTVVQTAHFGPNLLPWHRLYLHVVETALGVPIPYWDSGEDFEMKYPQKSIVWCPKYFGNGYGPVVTGPFAGFFIPPIGIPVIRMINSWGALLDRKAITKYVLSQRRYADICTPTAKHKSNMEGYHNNVHAWINGIMGNLPFSAYDPVFFCLHSMIDNYWEQFRAKQAQNGIDPSKDFVKVNIPGHAPWEKAMLKGFINKEGYSHGLARKVVYGRQSQCPSCHGGSDKYCDNVRGVCVSRSYISFGSSGISVAKGIAKAKSIAKKSGLSAGRLGIPFPVYAVDPRVRGDPLQGTGGVSVQKAAPVAVRPVVAEPIISEPVVSYRPDPIIWQSVEPAYSPAAVPFSKGALY